MRAGFKSAFLLFTLLTLCFSGFSFSKESKETNKVEQVSFEHKNFTTPMVFNVTLPDSYDKETDRQYVVMFDIHPRTQPVLSGLHNWLSHNGEWPWLDTIIVTPAKYHKEYGKLFEHTIANPSDQTILDFWQQSIIKRIDQKYRTNGFRIYSGFMTNGAFGLYSLLNRPELFDAYFIASPTLNDDMLNVVSQSPTKLKTLNDKMRFLYLTIGDHRFETAHVGAVRAFEKVLESSAPQDLDWKVETGVKGYYMTRPVNTVVDGIEMLFDDFHKNLSADSQVSQQGTKAIIEYYQNLSKRKYGFEVSAEGSLNNLAKSHLASNPTKAIVIYKEVVELYPDSSYAYSNLADAYKEMGQLDAALVQQKAAVKKSILLNAWHQRQQKKKLVELEALMTESSK